MNEKLHNIKKIYILKINSNVSSQKERIRFSIVGYWHLGAKSICHMKMLVQPIGE